MERRGTSEDGGLSLVFVGEGAWDKAIGRVGSYVGDDGRSRAGRVKQVV